MLKLRSLDSEIKAQEHDDDHSHTEDIATVAITASGDIDGLKLSQWFRGLLAEFGERMMRMKGILNLRRDPDQFVFQGVHLLFEGRPAVRGRKMNSDSIAWFLSGDLDREKITQGFMSCMTDDSQGRRL